MARITAGVVAAISAVLVSGSVQAEEFPIGGPVTHHHLQIASAYLENITTSPMPVSMAMGENIVHLETDVHALKGNPWGYSEGSWVPYLSVDYVIRKEGDDHYLEFGHLLPMSAADGPHYANSVKLAGKGRYTVIFKYSAPDDNGYQRHVDKATGIDQWFSPFTQRFTFDYPQKTQ
ncbi:34 kDa membrane antigen [Carnimonas sp. R-84981]|uniref:iron transporter n=1 Tax=Carnimonas bestiolae TaxID=3402172 RepID=UPI003EDC9CCA